MRIEVVNSNWQVIEGRSFADCDNISGDSLNHLVAWRGQSDIGCKPDEPVKLRFQLRYAELFSVEFK